MFDHKYIKQYKDLGISGLTNKIPVITARKSSNFRTKNNNYRIFQKIIILLKLNRNYALYIQYNSHIMVNVLERARLIFEHIHINTRSIAQLLIFVR